MPDETVNLSLSQAEALVLFEFLARFDQNRVLQIEDESERVVLSNVLCMLEKQLSTPFDPHYSEFLAAARQTLRVSEGRNIAG
jgi:hypothetical protein